VRPLALGRALAVGRTLAVGRALPPPGREKLGLGRAAARARASKASGLEAQLVSARSRHLGHRRSDEDE